MAKPDKAIVIFVRTWTKYVVGDVAGFEESRAMKLVAAGVAEPYDAKKHGKPGERVRGGAKDMAVQIDADLAEAEAALAAREAEIAEREAAIAKREAEIDNPPKPNGNSGGSGK